MDQAIVVSTFDDIVIIHRNYNRVVPSIGRAAFRPEDNSRLLISPLEEFSPLIILSVQYLLIDERLALQSR